MWLTPEFLPQASWVRSAGVYGRNGRANKRLSFDGRPRAPCARRWAREHSLSGDRGERLLFLDVGDGGSLKTSWRAALGIGPCATADIWTGSGGARGCPVWDTSRGSLGRSTARCAVSTALRRASQRLHTSLLRLPGFPPPPSLRPRVTAPVCSLSCVSFSFLDIDA